MVLKCPAALSTLQHNPSLVCLVLQHQTPQSEVLHRVTPVSSVLLLRTYTSVSIILEMVLQCPVPPSLIIQCPALQRPVLQAPVPSCPDCWFQHHPFCLVLVGLWHCLVYGLALSTPLGHPPELFYLPVPKVWLPNQHMPQPHKWHQAEMNFTELPHSSTWHTSLYGEGFDCVAFTVSASFSILPSCCGIWALLVFLATCLLVAL